MKKKQKKRKAPMKMCISPSLPKGQTEWGRNLFVLQNFMRTNGKTTSTENIAGIK